MASAANHKTAMCHATHDEGPMIWTSKDSREHPVASRVTTPAIAKAQPARKTRSDTFKVSCTKHGEMHGVCPMTSEN